jgi:hypothetical protein
MVQKHYAQHTCTCLQAYSVHHTNTYTHIGPFLKADESDSVWDYIHTYKYICTDASARAAVITYFCIYTYTYIYTHACINVYMAVIMYFCVHAYTYIHINVCIYVYMAVIMYCCIYTYTYVHTHACIYIYEAVIVYYCAHRPSEMSTKNASASNKITYEGQGSKAHFDTKISNDEEGERRLYHVVCLSVCLSVC